MSGEILAIDQGTTGTKVLVVSPAGDIVGRSVSEFSQHYPRPGWVEHDPEEIWRVTHRVAAEAVEAAGVRADDLAGIGITNQRETTVLWDRTSGRPVHNAIVWQDRRTTGICERLRSDGLGPTVRQRTGLVIDPYFSGTKIAWLLDHVDGLRDRAAAGDIAFGTVDSWLVWKLTGGATHVTDYSNASRTLLYDIHALDWDSDLLRALDVPSQLLPEVRPSSTVYAETDGEAFLAGGVPVAGIAGDQQAALFAQACYEPGLAKNTYGTGSFVLMNRGTDSTQGDPVHVTGQSARVADGVDGRGDDQADPPHGPLTTIAWGIGEEPVTYALEGAIFVTGSAVQWLRDELGIIDEAGETEPLAAGLDGNDDVYFVPALTGLGAPFWDPRARGTMVGLTRGTTTAHIARATLEAISYQTRDVVESMRRASGTNLTELRADGGASVNDWLMQFQADVLDVPVVVPTITETTALGSAYLAGLATGVWNDRDDLDARWEADRRFEPAMSRDHAEALYDRWGDAVDRARGWASDPS